MPTARSTNGTHVDCNTCIASGHVVRCIVCNGDGSVGGGRRRSSRRQCGHCGGRSGYPCQTCDMSGQVWTFSRFCVGDGPDFNPTRHHPNARLFIRLEWSRYEEP